MTESVDKGNAIVDQQREDIVKNGLIVVKSEINNVIANEVNGEPIVDVDSSQLVPVEQDFLPEAPIFNLNRCKIEPSDEPMDGNGLDDAETEEFADFSENNISTSVVKTEDENVPETPVETVTEKASDCLSDSVEEDKKNRDDDVSPLFGAIKRKKHECEVCMKTFSYRCELRAHRRTHTGEKPYACHVCRKEFFHKSSLKTHMSSHMEEETVFCSLCEKTFSSNYFRKHVLIHTSEKRVICNICDRAFAFNSELESHKRTHTGEKPFVCATCEKSFATKYSLQVHIQIHSGERPFICRECNKTFARKDVLLTHMQSHSGERPFACNVCNRRFPRKGLIKLHMRSHLAEKNYPCYICNKALSRRDSMLRHIQLNHPGHQK